MLSVQLSASYKHAEMEEVEVRGKNNFLNPESKQKGSPAAGSQVLCHAQLQTCKLYGR